MTAEQQLQVLRRGAAEIVPEADLLARLKSADSNGRPLRVKLGVDPTAPDLHLGHSVVLRKLRDFQRLGHEVILVIGDFTAAIGDPSGRSQTRPPLAEAEIRAAADSYQQQCYRILDRERTEVVYNSRWLGAMRFADVVRLTSHYTVARLLERDDFAKRFAAHQPISVHEFLYSFCQAQDSVELQADVELGGSDQLFNILMGRDLQREAGQPPQVAFILPILPGLDGVQKMSKSLGNTIGITEPPQPMFDKLMSLSDALMPEYFRLLTDLDEPEITSILAGHPLEAKKRLAAAIVSEYHDAEAAAAARARWEQVFSRRQLPDDLPTLEVAAGQFNEAGRLWLPRLMTLAGLAGGSREARRLIEQGAVQVDGARISDVNTELTLERDTVVQVGRRRFVRARRGSRAGSAER